MRIVLVLLTMVLLATPAWAVNPGEVLADPALEARARAISSELRCLVCQNQSIDDSDADLAAELRVIVRERLTAGDSDAETRQFIVDRYGEYVLLRPVIAPHTILLWIMAPALLLIGGVVLFLAMARRVRSPEPASGGAPLSAEESAALAALEADSPKR